MERATGPRATAEVVRTRAELAGELTVLRVKSGLTVRELAHRLDVPAATLGGYFSGRHLPGPGYVDLYCSLLEACGVPANELAPWLEALTRARLSSDGRVALPSAPYRGLEPYHAEDSAVFCGRELATSEVLERLANLATRGGPGGLLALVGPSGSGKSSLLRAGVVPAVRSGALDGMGRHWMAEVMTPGPLPLEALERCLSCPAEGPRLIVVDQFEEVFRLPPETRRSFLAHLGAIEPAIGVVVAVLRADFYEAATMEPVLLASLRHNQVLVGPMTEEEVRQAVVQPAESVGVGVDDGLVELLLADLAPRSPTGFAHEAGALPLLSHALLATWERAERNQLTVAAYRASGGFQGAVRQSAEELYLDLNVEDKELARRIFCRLVNVEDDLPNTRRRMNRHELEQLGDKATSVLGRFVSARLLTADASGVQVSHEVLLSAWPRLAEWLDSDRAGLRLHHGLSDGANSWLAAGRDPALLQRGTRLALALEWATEPGHDQELSHSEREFLAASQSLQDAEVRAARRRTRRTQQLLGLVAALATVASLLAGLAIRSRSEATTARNEALSRQVAIEASQLGPTDPALAMQLALAAYRISPTVQARSTLIDASASEMPTRILGPAGPTGTAVAAHGHLLAVAHSATNEVDLYSLATKRPQEVSATKVAIAADDTFAVALSPDGQLLAAGGTGGTVALFDLSNLRHPKLLATLRGFKSTVYGVTFGPTGQSLAAASNDGSVRQWDLGQAGRPTLSAVVRSPSGQSLSAVAYSPDGHLMAAVGAGGTLLLWRPGQDRARVVAGSGSAQLTSVAFSPNGELLATGGQDDVVRVFSVTSSGAAHPAHAPLHGFSSWVGSVAFAPDGRSLVAGSSDNSLREWSTSNWSSLAVVEQTAPVTSAAFLPSGRSLVTAGSDGTVRLWSVPPPSTYLAPGPVFTVDYTSNGRMLAAVSGGPRGDVGLWDATDPWRPVHIANVEMPSSFGPVEGVEALSPNGRLLAVGDAGAHIRLVSLANVRRPRLVGPLLSGATPPLEQLALNPQGTVLASVDNSGRVHLWDVKNPAQPRDLSTLPVNGYDMGVAFSPNGRLVAVASTDGKVWLWDISRPTHPKRLAVLGGFASYVYAVTFTPDGRTLIAGSADDTVRLWDVAVPARPKPLGGPLTGPTSYVYSLSVSPDGRVLAASTIDHAVWLWDISAPAHPTVLADLGAASGEVFDVTFSPNGRTLVASGSDKTLTFWDYRPAEVAARVCALTVSPITRAEWAEYVQGAAYSPPCH